MTAAAETVDPGTVVVDLGPPYTSARVCELTGCTYRQLDHWVRSGRIAVEQPARGSGAQRLFSVEQTEVVYHAVRLVWAGFTLNAALMIAHDLVAGDGVYHGTVGEVFDLTVSVKAGLR